MKVRVSQFAVRNLRPKDTAEGLAAGRTIQGDNDPLKTEVKTAALPVFMWSVHWL